MNEIERAYKRLLYSHVGSDYAWPEKARVASSDILLHLPVLRYYASLSTSVIEFGVRDGYSTLALATGLTDQIMLRRMHSFDIQESPFVERMKSLAQESNWSGWTFTALDTIGTQSVQEVPEADLFFFDTLHTDRQIREELRLHGHKARKYLIFHDTTTCGEKDRSGARPDAPGILAGITEYAIKNGLLLAYESKDCNGLMVYARKIIS